MTTEAEAKTYNGWANYETWCVHLWLSNEEADYRYWRGQAAECKAEAADEDERNVHWTEAEHARFTLADRLKDQLQDASCDALGDTSSLWADLLGAALSEVDWHEIADAFLEE